MSKFYYVSSNKKIKNDWKIRKKNYRMRKKVFIVIIGNICGLEYKDILKNQF